MLDEAFGLFVKAAPATVLIRGVQENIFDDVAGNWRGTMVVLTEGFRERKFGSLTSTELAENLKNLARGADLSKYRKRPPTRKTSPRPPPK